LNNNNKTIALFLAAVLMVEGVIALSSPYTAFAQGYDGYG
jgi:hypothetical protein